MEQNEEARMLLEQCVDLGYGFEEDEREPVIDRLMPLGRRLQKVDPEKIRIEVGAKDREGPEQRVVVEVAIASKGATTFVGTSTKPELDPALDEARSDVIRQINYWKGKHEEQRRNGFHRPE
ncbi:hypothetical protein [Salininema proteolyticum]|uniref:HPF/RaiA family ribosome-associated protein n=1 Tax=Salininema proteolyticum TaxID=1607685 RepID=A0ABV8U3A4_9ACTN